MTYDNYTLRKADLLKHFDESIACVEKVFVPRFRKTQSNKRLLCADLAHRWWNAPCGSIKPRADYLTAW